MKQDRPIPKEALALESIYYTNRNAIVELETQNEDLILKLIAGFHGVKIGDVVVCTEERPLNRKGKHFKIQRFDQTTWSEYGRSSKPWIYGYPMNSNGEFSKKPILIYGNWNRIPDVIPGV